MSFTSLPVARVGPLRHNAPFLWERVTNGFNLFVPSPSLWTPRPLPSLPCCSVLELIIVCVGPPGVPPSCQTSGSGTAQRLKLLKSLALLLNSYNQLISPPPPPPPPSHQPPRAFPAPQLIFDYVQIQRFLSVTALLLWTLISTLPRLFVYFCC